MVKRTKSDAVIIIASVILLVLLIPVLWNLIKFLGGIILGFFLRLILLILLGAAL